MFFTALLRTANYVFPPTANRKSLFGHLLKRRAKTSIVIGLVGIAALILIAGIFSSERKAINLRTVGGAFTLQAAIAAFVILTSSGAGILQTISNGVQVVIDSANAGIAFLLGGLVSDKMFEVFDGGGFVFAVMSGGLASTAPLGLDNAE